MTSWLNSWLDELVSLNRTIDDLWLNVLPSLHRCFHGFGSFGCDIFPASNRSILDLSSGWLDNRSDLFPPFDGVVLDLARELSDWLSNRLSKSPNLLGSLHNLLATISHEDVSFISQKV